LVQKGNRGVLLELARKKASETYSFRKGKSRSKAYGTSKDGSPTPKQPKLDKEMRDNRISDLNEIIQQELPSKRADVSRQKLFAIINFVMN